MELKEPKNILIVEDEAIIALLIEQTLLAGGCSICGVAESGSEAMALVKQHTPDLILMDIKIKGDMDGIDTAKAITSTWKIPIIFLSAFSDAGTLKRADDIEHCGFFNKPLRANALLSAVESALA